MWASLGICLLALAVQHVAGDGCLFEGKIYQQGQTWTKPCQYNCVCDNAATGHYTCTDICPTYDNLPAGCHLVKPPGEPCCSAPQCDFQTSHTGTQGSGTGTTSCTDKLPNCNDYGQTVCTDHSYAQWVADNCARFCGCRTLTGTGTMTGTGTGTGTITGTGTGTGTITGTGTGTGTITGTGTGTGTGTITGTGTGHITGTGTMTGCTDVLQNCNAYGDQMCLGQYEQWARQNCAHYCGLCGSMTGTGTGTITGTGTVTGTGTGTGTGTYQIPPLGTGTGTGTITGTGTGTGYLIPPMGSGTGTGTGTGTGYLIPPMGSGTGTGTVTGTGTGTITGTGTGTITGAGTGTITGTGTMTGSTTCTGDKIANCDAYGTNVCSDSQYSAWAHENCCHYCHMGGSTGTGSGTITGTGSGTGTTTCAGDKINNCAAYGANTCSDASYAPWVAENCCMYCMTVTHGNSGNHNGHEIQIGSGGTCGGDKIQNCAAYGANVCSDPQYAAWIAENCCAFCHTGAGAGTITGSGGGTHTGPITGSSTGCTYKGQVYQQGQAWNDGCQYKCTCTDASTGHYQCQDPCYTFNIPPACHMDPPAAGKCCATPACPSGITIQYPAGYVAA